MKVTPMARLKIAVVGSRSWTDAEAIHEILNSYYENTILGIEIVSGGAMGVDRIAKHWALEYRVPIQEFLPDWQKHGKSAGMIRNTDIIKEADVVLCFWDGVSAGTKNSLDKALKMKKELHVYFMETPAYPLEKPDVGKDIPFPVQGDE